MFKSIALLAIIAFSSANAGVITTHTVVEPVVTKVGAVVHSVPSAVSHQSFTRIHNKARVTDVIAPVVRSVQVAVPVVKTVPVQHIVKTVEVAPVVKAVQVHAAPIVSHVQYSAPLVKTYSTAPVIHASPIVHVSPYVKTISSPVTYAINH